MLTNTHRWSHTPGNTVVPSRWQATAHVRAVRTTGMGTGLRPRRHVVKALLAVVTALCLHGCSEAPEEDWYATANGADTEVGKVEVRSLLIVASEVNEPGRLLGTLFNTSDESGGSHTFGRG